MAEQCAGGTHDRTMETDYGNVGFCARIRYNHREMFADVGYNACIRIIPLVPPVRVGYATIMRYNLREGALRNGFCVTVRKNLP